MADDYLILPMTSCEYLGCVCDLKIAREKPRRAKRDPMLVGARRLLRTGGGRLIERLLR